MAVEYQLVEFTGGDYEKYHERWKDRPVEIALELRGFYVKVGANVTMKHHLPKSCSPSNTVFRWAK